MDKTKNFKQYWESLDKKGQARLSEELRKEAVNNYIRIHWHRKELEERTKRSQRRNILKQENIRLLKEKRWSLNETH